MTNLTPISSPAPSTKSTAKSTEGHENRSFVGEEMEFYPSLPDDGAASRVTFNMATAEVHIHPASDPPVTPDENDQSPYEEVAANVSNHDDPTMAVLTFRSWSLGLAFTCLLSFVNQFFWYRTSPLVIGVLVAQLLSHLFGKLMARFLPTRSWKIFRWSFTLNPGPFTVKEHCIITAMAGAAAVEFRSNVVRQVSVSLFRERPTRSTSSPFNG